jgi:hypothetical protein
VRERHTRNFYKVEKWTKDGIKVDRMHADSSADTLPGRPKNRNTARNGAIRRRWSRLCFLPIASVSLGDLEELVMAERCRIEDAGLDSRIRDAEAR